jgi:hypothetical protein
VVAELAPLGPHVVVIGGELFLYRDALKLLRPAQTLETATGQDKHPALSNIALYPILNRRGRGRTGIGSL